MFNLIKDMSNRKIIIYSFSRAINMILFRLEISVVTQDKETLISIQ